MSERFDFIRRWQDGERVVDLCREFGISRKTAYKIISRFQRDGPHALFDHSRRPLSSPRQTPPAIEKLVLAVRRRHSTWGPKKIFAWLTDHHPEVHVPCETTINVLLNRHHIPRRPLPYRKQQIPHGAPLRTAAQPNDIWCADFKGEFKLRNGRYCYPLTITDRYSRYLIRCEALESTKLDPAYAVFERAFREYGLPKVIRTDNGAPFAGRALWGLSRLSVRWIRLGIWPERIAPAHPEQNGQHERMHLVLKQETTRPAGANFLQQQERFERFVETYNHERPHEALGQKPPATVYVPSPRPLPKKLADPEYPLHDRSYRVEWTGDVWLSTQHRFMLSSVLGGEQVGVRELEDGRWLISFMEFDLGHYDSRTRRFEANQLETRAQLTDPVLHGKT